MAVAFIALIAIWLVLGLLFVLGLAKAASKPLPSIPADGFVCGCEGDPERASMGTTTAGSRPELELSRRDAA